MQCTPVWREGTLDVDGQNALYKHEQTGQVGLMTLKECCELVLHVLNKLEINPRYASDSPLQHAAKVYIT
jgi:hypothetical protein